MIDQPNTSPRATSGTADTHRPVRRADRKARTREAILAAAGRAFASRGFEGASMREIATQARVAQPLLVYHFGSKEGVWRAAVDRLFGRVVSATERALEDAGDEAGAERMRVLLRSFVGVVANDPAWLQILLREAAEPGPRLDWLVDHHSRATYTAGVRFLEEARAEGLLPDLPADHLLYVLVGALTFVVAIAPEVQRVTRRDAMSDVFLDRHVDTLFSLLTSGGPAS